MPEVAIGKYTIESLTTGMYTDPYVIFREYIQNAADSIDEAVKSCLLPREAAHIKISIDPSKRWIAIEDNGTGLSVDSAYQTLADIGNSKKAPGVTRGFRGIGRFSGLSYCDRLIFSTSTIEESFTYSISFDAKKLRHLIASNTAVLTANDTMKQIITERRSSASTSHHFFRVVMENVQESSGLLNIEKVFDYLRQISPVAFDRRFSWGQSIVDAVTKQMGPLETYHITLETPREKVDITKAYTDTILLNRQTGVTDYITGISFRLIEDSEGNSIGYAWYGKSNFQGTIIGNEIKGLRIRVGNILIGDHTSLNHVFKDSRFNGWVIGEVYIRDLNLLPNARRDDFEHNDLYFILIERLRDLAADIVKEIRSASAERNKALGKSVNEAESIIAKANEVLESNERISPTQKGSISTRILKAKQHLNSQRYSGIDEDARLEAIEKLDILTGRVQGTASFRALNLLSDITRSDRLLLERVFVRLLEQYPSEIANHCIDMILDVLGHVDP